MKGKYLCISKAILKKKACLSLPHYGDTYLILYKEILYLSYGLFVEF